MSNNKQSSVEWLKDQLEYFGNKHELTVSWATIDDLIEQAKSMHKEECIDLLNHHNDIFDTSEEHYNKWFGGNNEQQ